MTAQINDLVIIHDLQFDVASWSDQGPFNPVDHGLFLSPATTAHIKGYQACYEIKSSSLSLTEIRVTLNAKFPQPFINDKKAQKTNDPNTIFSHTYNNLDLHINYTGALMAGRDLIQEFKQHMGYPQIWKYKTMIQIEFIDGHINNLTNVSEQMEKIRSSQK